MKEKVLLLATLLRE